MEAVKHNDRLTELSGIKQGEYLLEIEGYLSCNKEWRERNQQVKLLMMILQRRRDGNIVSNFPRRLLIYLVSFVDKVRVEKERFLNKQKDDKNETGKDGGYGKKKSKVI